jgi:hypothetical protein
LNINVAATTDERDQTNDLESVEKRIVRGATPEQEKLKAKKLSEKAHVLGTLRSYFRFARRNSPAISPHGHEEHERGER